MPTSRAQHSKALLLMLGSALSVSCAVALAQQILTMVSVPWLVFLRFFLPFLLITAICLVKGFPGLPQKKHCFLLLLRGVCFFAAQAAMFWYLKHSSLVLALTLLATSSVFIPIFDRLLFKHPLKTPVIISMSVTFVGVIVVLDPGAGQLNAWVFLGLLSGVLSALGRVSLNRVAKSEKPLSVALYTFFVGSVCAGVWVLFDGGFIGVQQFVATLGHGSSIVVYIALALFTVNTSLLRIKAYSMVNKTASITPVGYFSLVFTAIFGWYFFAQAITSSILVGVVLIILGSLVLLYRSKGE